MERVARIDSVRTSETRNGNTRFVARDEDGNEYSTFKERIGKCAQGLEGKLARISYHEATRDGHQNVYLDGVEAVGEVEYLVGERTQAAKPNDLFERVTPFKDLVADDIRSDGGDDSAQ
jgi:hypothetical protein